MNVDALQHINPANLSSLPELGTSSEPTGKNSFQNFFQQALLEVEEANAAVQRDGIELALGNLDNIAQAQIDIMKAETATQIVVQVTSRAVNAYKEIMQMQV